MRQLSPHRLWIGNVLDSRVLRSVLDQRIQVMVDLAANETPPIITRDLAYLRLPLLDGAGNSPWLVRLAVESVWRLVQANVPTLVYCSAGMSRAPTIAAAVIALHTKTPLADCLGEVTKDAPHDISPGLMTDVQAVLAQIG